MLSFFSPLFLIGILGASIPVIIHLINRRRAVVHRFAAIDFILQSHERFAARFKFRQLLLLILRALLVALLSMALAKPFLKSVGGASLSTNVPTSNVVIVDDSYSMGYTIEGQTLFENAKEGAKQLISSLGLVDDAAILSCSNPTPERLSNLSVDKKKLLEKIDRLQLSHFTTKIADAVEKACEILDTSQQEAKRIFLFTDLAKSGWNEKQFSLVNTKLQGGKYKIIISDVSGGRELNNTAVVGVEARYDPTEKEAQVAIKVVVNNFSSLPANELLCRVIIGKDVVAQGFISADANSSITKEFLWEPTKGGSFTGHVEIVNDNLAIDDIRYFVINIAKDITVLVVDGDPGINIYESESFYLERALNPSRAFTSHVKAIISNPTEVATTRLKDFDLIFLCNVEALSPEKVIELQSFVSEGGGLVFTLGDRVDIKYYNKNLDTLLPNTLRGVKEFSRPTASETEGLTTDPSKGQRALSLDESESVHPVLRFLQSYTSSKDNGTRTTGLSKAQFHKIYLVDPGTIGSSAIILKYSNDAPALVEKRYGKGNVMLFTSTIDRDWNDLPVKPVFLPLIQQLCRYLTGTITEIGKKDVLVGEKYELSTSEDIGAVNFTDPNENTERLQSEVIGGERKIIYTGTNYQGFYNITPLNYPLTKTTLLSSPLTQTTPLAPPLTKGGRGDYTPPQGSEEGVHTQMKSSMSALPPYFAVNIDTTESDLSKIDRQDITKILGTKDTSPPVVLAGGMQDKEPLVSGQTKRLWGSILLMALCVLCLEAFISHK